MFQTKAMIHSLKSEDTVTVLHENGANDVVAEYSGIRYTAIYNPFVGLYYVDNIYGELKDPNKCPNCGDRIS